MLAIKLRIKFEEHSRIIGSITANGIVWRNKLIYWTDCDKNETKIELLHLADHPVNSSNGLRIAEESNANESNILDRIFDYLDVTSLQKFAETSEKSKQLMKNYVEKHSKKHGTFTFIDEIYPFKSSGNWYMFDDLQLTQHVTDLKVYAVYTYSKEHINNVIKIFKHLDKLSIYDECPEMEWPRENLTSISHVIYDSPHFIFGQISDDIRSTFPHAQKIEFKKVGQTKMVSNI